MMKRRILSLIIAMMCMVTLLTGCGGKIEGSEAYIKAYKSLAETTLTEEGTYAVTEDLVIALEEADFSEPKNIIYMIGDGMGKNIIETTRVDYKDALYEGKLAIDLIPQVGWQSTYSADAQITDSAAGGTALSSGYKTSNGTIAMDKYDKVNYKTVLELAAEKGMNTGIVATKAVTDATPASFTAHVADRGMQNEIAAQQMDMMRRGDLDLIMGGGLNYYVMGENAAQWQELENKGISLATDWEGTKEGELPFIGLYAAEHLYTYDTTLPTVAEMTAFALDKLSAEKEGFFLMVEGSQIDTKAHENSYFDETKEMYDFDCAIAVALKFVAMNPDTVLVITADHETGGLHLPMIPTENVYSNFCYTSTNHTCIQVPVYAIGHDTEALRVIQDNTDVARYIAALLGEEEFGYKSEIYPLFTNESKQDYVLYFDDKITSWKIPTEEFEVSPKKVKNARALHFKVCNTSSVKVHLPTLCLKGIGEEYFVSPQVDYMEAGEEMVLTYILPANFWEMGAFGGAAKMELTYKMSEEVAWKQVLRNDITEKATFRISEIWITDRTTEQ